MTTLMTRYPGIVQPRPNTIEGDAPADAPQNALRKTIAVKTDAKKASSEIDGGDSVATCMSSEMRYLRGLAELAGKRIEPTEFVLGQPAFDDLAGDAFAPFALRLVMRPQTEAAPSTTLAAASGTNSSACVQSAVASRRSRASKK